MFIAAVLMPLVAVPVAAAAEAPVVVTLPAAAPVNAAAPIDPSATPAAAEAQAPAAQTPAPVAGDAPAQGEDIMVTGRASDPADPLQKLNVESFKVVQSVDKAVIQPVTDAYQEAPKPLRKGLHNFLTNLDEPVAFLNFLLQLKPGKAAETLGRFAINSTIGIAGVIDVAKKKPFNLPHRPNGFANTLGYYGVGPGPYFYLPIIGSTTLRDVLARPFDVVVLPLAVGKPFTDPVFATTKFVASAIDERAEFDAKVQEIRKSDDPYVAMREYYLEKRAAEIDVLKGRRDCVACPPKDGSGHAPATVPVEPAAPVVAPAESPAQAAPAPAVP